jgi:citrate lyase subunit beta/citryl-CoA lyase
MLARAGTRGADGVILNLEDAVAPARKEQARAFVATALSTGDLGGAERIVRINQLDSDLGFSDLLAIVPLAPDAILLSKTPSAEQVRHAAWIIDRLESIHGLPAEKVRIMCMIETATGVLAASEIASAHRRVTALLFGAADFSADVNCEVIGDQYSILHATNHVILAARGARVSAIDAPYMKLDNSEGLEQSARMARQLGFDGKSAIHPAQIPAIHAAFTPSHEQVRWAYLVTEALSASVEPAGTTGVAVLDGQLIEAPHLLRAQRILDATRRLGTEDE